MVDARIPSGMPDCALLEILASKVHNAKRSDFDFLGRLNEIRQCVSGEIRFINNLFPEYTPHDEEYHTAKLFSVADTV